MRYRRFGKTNLSLSVLSVGTMRCLDSREIFQQTLQQAIVFGINHIETARGYGQSERYLGMVFEQSKAIVRSQVYITTKLPPTPDADQMKKWINESLERLQVDYIDCLAIHGINTWEHLQWITDSNGCLNALQEALNDGRVLHLGFSTHGSLELILAAIETDLFEFVNLHYYYFFQRHERAIALAHEKDMGVFIISPADKGGRLYTPSDTLKALCSPFSPLELTYRFLLSDRRITTLSMGPANPKELEAMILLRDQDEPLTAQEVSVFKGLETHLDQALGTDQCRQCYECLPCPENINIPEILRLRNLAVAYDMTGFGQYRYRMLENAGHWFPGNKGNRCTECGDCLPRCPEKLEIPTLLKDTHQRLNGSPRRRLWE
ncbi:aldo/keto reductase [Aphanothece sacrum]|uniref:Aldo/keto reductase family protein n=1 Tax=Aphanothece sacrum FPU1 TaxID=1920663 RepID=A0A401IG23_APHSA|nr:aldo/keto reductase [Aphanothece sacrum]GBF80166.1 aldo/keto reductase family protein [Aphanothece sacrum FPU1]GBF85319.1 oxidoreductase, aldo/keto reductase family [Aphanothece sacrum FPU3]